MKLNIAYPESGSQKTFELDDDKAVQRIVDKRVAQVFTPLPLHTPLFLPFFSTRKFCFFNEAQHSEQEYLTEALLPLRIFFSLSTLGELDSITQTSLTLFSLCYILSITHTTTLYSTPLHSTPHCRSSTETSSETPTRDTPSVSPEDPTSRDSP